MGKRSPSSPNIHTGVALETTETRVAIKTDNKWRSVSFVKPEFNETNRTWNVEFGTAEVSPYVKGKCPKM
jgi:hypothetical protein